MSKLAADGKPLIREDGKVLKSEQYFPPDIASALGRLTLYSLRSYSIST